MRRTVRDAMRFFPGKPRKIASVNVKYKRTIDKRTEAKIEQFVRDSFSRMNLVSLSNRAVVGISGGLDSTVTAVLCKRALGNRQVLGVIVDKDHEETRDSELVAREIGIPYVTVGPDDLISKFASLVKLKSPLTGINVETRVVQSIIFQIADGVMGSVFATTDKSERLLGRHTECFYGHIAPLVDLYKTELVELARAIDVPDRVLSSRPGCKNWWWDDEVFGVSYQTLDPILYLMSEKRLSAARIASKYNIDRVWLRKIEARLRNQKLRVDTQELRL
jgi:NAD+ synthase